MGKIRKGRSERQEVTTISLDWVSRHQHILTPRDIAILDLLRRFPVMTVEQIIALTPETKTPSGKVILPFYQSGHPYKLCRDRIRRLFDYHFVNKYSPRLGLGEGTSPQYVWLDRAGYRYFGLSGRPLKHLTAEYRHHAAILDVYILFVQLEREGLIDVDFLEVCYHNKPVSINIEPDLVVCFRKGAFGYKYLIEVDTGEKKERDEAKKILRYRDWELSGHWIRERWSDIYKQKFPSLLYVFSTDKRITRRMNALEKQAKSVQCRYDGLALSSLREKILSLQ